MFRQLYARRVHRSKLTFLERLEVFNFVRSTGAIQDDIENVN